MFSHFNRAASRNGTKSAACALAVTVLVTVVPVGRADVTGEFLLSAVDGNGALPGSLSFDLVIDVFSSPYYTEDWTAAGVYGTLTDGVFYQDPDNDGNPPDPELFDEYPASQWTSFYTGPGDWPNLEIPGYREIQFATNEDTATSLYTEWFDVTDTGEGTFTLARVTVIPEAPDWWLHIDGVLARASGDSLYYFAFDVPDPGTGLLLLLGGFTAFVRRR